MYVCCYFVHYVCMYVVHSYSVIYIYVVSSCVCAFMHMCVCVYAYVCMRVRRTFVRIYSMLCVCGYAVRVCVYRVLERVSCVRVYVVHSCICLAFVCM